MEEKQHDDVKKLNTVIYGANMNETNLNACVMKSYYIIDNEPKTVRIKTETRN